MDRGHAFSEDGDISSQTSEHSDYEKAERSR